MNHEILMRSPDEIVKLLEKQLESPQFEEEVTMSIESSYRTLPMELQQFLLILSVFPSSFDNEVVSFMLDSSLQYVTIHFFGMNYCC